MNDAAPPLVVEVFAAGRGRVVRPGAAGVAGRGAGVAATDGALGGEVGLPLDAGRPGDLLLVAPGPSADDGRTHAIVKRLASGSSGKAKLWKIALELGHQATYPPAVEAEARAWVAEPGVDDATLIDWTDVPFVTIDNVGSRDLDQALHLERWSRPDEPGPAGYRLRYALADAAYYVRPGSALFAEGLLRGASFYMPGIAIAMLPPCLSEGSISLNPKVERRSFVMDIRLDAQGQCVHTEVVRARIRSRAKLTYPGVQSFYAVGEAHPLAKTEYAGSLQLLAEVGLLRKALARAADVVSFQRAEVDVQIEGASFSVVADQRLPVERYNEQISLLCNMEGARLLRRYGGEGQGVFKVHPAPPAEKLERLARTIDAVVKARALPRERWRWRRGREPLAEYLDRLPRSGPNARVTEAIERQAMMANVGSTFSDGPAPHFGVGAPAYARFSAPMREIVGIFTHKEALEELGMLPPSDRAADEALREQVIDAANRAHKRQRQLTKACNQLVLDTLLERELKMAQLGVKTGPTADAQPSVGGVAPQARWRTGTLLGMTATKLYVRLDAPPIEVKIYLRDLPREGARPRISAHGGSFQLGERHIALGERLELRVRGRSQRSGRWAFDLRFPERTPVALADDPDTPSDTPSDSAAAKS